MDAFEQYVRAMFGNLGNTLGLENTFNDLRDNEGRGARRKTRSNERLQSLAVSSLTTRYSESER
eukprot:15484465-Alexandrium_andersonii.AAC.1